MTKIDVKKGLVSIIILNYNGEKFLENCLESIFKETKQDYEIIVVDNDSPDKSGEKFSKKYHECNFILNKENVGVSEGLNIGIRNANGEFIVLLNNDLIVAPKWLDYLFEAYMNKGEGLYQPKFLKMKDRSIIDSAGNLINIFGFGFSREKGKKDLLQYNIIEEIGFAAGTCLFCPKEIFDKVGLFDEKLFAYNEDLDLGWRARLLNYRSYYVPESIVYHYGSAQWKWSGEKFYLLERNRWVVLLSNYETKTILKLLPSLLIIEIGLIVFFTKKKMLVKKLRSYLGIIRLSNHIRKRRKTIRKIKKVQDEQIFESFCCTIETPLEVSETENIEKFNKLLKILCKIAGFYKISKDM
ncbi:glycosyltransferase family 2 protein [Nitrosopumilus ureiphilus]|uniref:Glycosyl transferase n=1 Tax=Nitrosopumilus ureiphilus TaxID=1470067 RepID=A0A7D5M627_9ARCH|nr:glycosyltransferase family 2 protein [Nitrosopumilus ureiphilus]QLH05767.1 glycosyl transferase [Nitrosopumilus ureiphilus]